MGAIKRSLPSNSFYLSGGENSSCKYWFVCEFAFRRCANNNWCGICSNQRSRFLPPPPLARPGKLG